MAASSTLISEQIRMCSLPNTLICRLNTLLVVGSEILDILNFLFFQSNTLGFFYFGWR